MTQLSGRFLTEDPARSGDNWFAYCDNDPLSRIDPTGLEYYGAGNWERETNPAVKIADAGASPGSRDPLNTPIMRPTHEQAVNELKGTALVAGGALAAAGAVAAAPAVVEAATPVVAAAAGKVVAAGTAIGAVATKAKDVATDLYAKAGAIVANNDAINLAANIGAKVADATLPPGSAKGVGLQLPKTETTEKAMEAISKASFLKTILKLFF